MEQAQQGIFQSAAQAVQVAFVVMSHEASPGTPFRSALLRVMEQVDLPSEQQRHWLDQLRGDRVGTVDFDGLSALDVRAQCAVIAKAIKTRLPAEEMWVLQAKYGVTDFEGEAGERRFAFSAERIAAIQGLSKWMAPKFSRIKPLALDVMLGRMFANHKRIDISSRALAAQFGGCDKKYTRASYKMANLVRGLEDQAIARLEPYFAESGLILEEVPYRFTARAAPFERRRLIHESTPGRPDNTSYDVLSRGK
jgi:hypothetical protein